MGACEATLGSLIIIGIGCLAMFLIAVLFGTRP